MAGGGAGGKEVGRISVRAVPNTDRFREDLRRQLEGIERDEKVRVPVELDTKGIREKLDEATRGRKVKVDVDVRGDRVRELDSELDEVVRKRREAEVGAKVDKPDFQKQLDEVKALARLADVKIKIGIEDREAEARLAGKIVKLKELAAVQRIKVKVDVDRDLGRGAIEGFVARLSWGASQAVSNAGSAAGGLLEGFSHMKASLPSMGSIGNFGSPINLLAILSLLPPALALFSSALVTLPALLGGAGVAAGTFALGMGGIKKALDDSGILKSTQKYDKKGQPIGKPKQGLGQQLTDLQTKVSGVFEKGFTPIFSKLAGVFPVVADGLPRVAQGFVDLAQGVTNALTSTTGVTAIKDLIQNTANAMSLAAPGIQSFSSAMLTLTDKVSAHFPGLAGMFNRLGTNVESWVGKISKDGSLDAAVHNLGPIADSVGRFLGKLVDAGLKLSADPQMANNITKVVDGLTNFIVNVLPQLNTIFGQLAGLFGKIQPPPGPPREDHPKAPKGAIFANKPDTPEVRPGEAPQTKPGQRGPDPRSGDPDYKPANIAQDFLHTLFPLPGQKSGNVLADVGQWFTNTFTRPATDHPVIMQGNVGGSQSAASVKDQQVGKVDWSPATAGAPEAFSKLIQAATAMVMAVMQQVQGMVTGIAGALQGLGAIGTAAGNSLGQGLANGITASTAAAVTAAANQASAVAAASKGALGIHSPSTVFHDIGRNIMTGMLGGMQEGHDAVVGQAQKTADAVAGAAAGSGKTYSTSAGGVKLTDSGSSFSGDPALITALSRAGVDPKLYPLLQGFAATEGKNPAGAWTLGFTDSQAGTSIDSHAKALAQQIKDRESVAGKFPEGGSKQEQAAWIARVVGQAGSSSDWQGNAQPSVQDYTGNIVRNFGSGAPSAPVHNPVAALGNWQKFGEAVKAKGLLTPFGSGGVLTDHKPTPPGSGAALGNWDKFAALAQGKGLLGQALVGSTPSSDGGAPAPSSSGGGLGTSPSPSYGYSPAASDTTPLGAGTAVGTGLMTGIQQGLDAGLPGVVKSAQDVSQQLQDAIANGGQVTPGLASSTQSALKDIVSERKALEAESHSLGKGDPRKKEIVEQRKQLEDLAKQIRGQEDQLGGAKRFNKEAKQSEQNFDPSQFINKGVAAGQNFAMANISQFENDIGISGNGAIPTIAKEGLSWATNMLSGFVSSAFKPNQGGTTNIHVNNVDDAIAAHRNIQNQKAMQYTGR